MSCSELTLRRVIEKLDTFNPVKIIFNGILLYNDYDSEIELEDGVYGETLLPITAIPDRLWRFDNYIVTSIDIEIVQYHHSIVSLQGEYKEVNVNV